MDYLKESERTLSNNFYGDNIDLNYVINLLVTISQNIRELDKIKKSVFYGKDNNLPEPINENFSSLSTGLDCLTDDKQKSVNLFHAIVGIATESGELIDALLNAMATNQKLDLINLCEEHGDLQWYEAILARECEFTFEQSQEKNIAKLKHRYPNKFTEEMLYRDWETI